MRLKPVFRNSMSTQKIHFFKPPETVPPIPILEDTQMYIRIQDAGTVDRMLPRRFSVYRRFERKCRLHLQEFKINEICGRSHKTRMTGYTVLKNLRIRNSILCAWRIKRKNYLTDRITSVRQNSVFTERKKYSSSVNHFHGTKLFYVYRQMSDHFQAVEDNWAQGSETGIKIMSKKRRKGIKAYTAQG